MLLLTTLHCGSGIELKLKLFKINWIYHAKKYECSTKKIGRSVDFPTANILIIYVVYSWNRISLAMISQFSWQFYHIILASFFCAHMSICFSVAISVRLLLIELYNVWFTSLQQQRENMNENGEKITHSVWMNINCTFTCCIWPLLHNDVAMAVVLVFFSCLHSFIQPFHFLTRQ